MKISDDWSRWVTQRCVEQPTGFPSLNSEYLCECSAFLLLHWFSSHTCLAWALKCWMQGQPHSSTHPSLVPRAALASASASRCWLLQLVVSNTRSSTFCWAVLFRASPSHSVFPTAGPGWEPWGPLPLPLTQEVFLHMLLWLSESDQAQWSLHRPPKTVSELVLCSLQKERIVRLAQILTQSC